MITNAIEAMPGGGDIRIRARKHRNCVLVEIEDTGSGIPHEIRDRVFEPFVTASKANGLGLGLALCRKAVLEHGGDMWVEAAVGARFVIRFPFTNPSLQTAVAVTGPVEATHPITASANAWSCSGNKHDTESRTDNEVTYHDYDRFARTNAMSGSQGLTIESELATQG